MISDEFSSNCTNALEKSARVGAMDNGCCEFACTAVG